MKFFVTYEKTWKFLVSVKKYISNLTCKLTRTTIAWKKPNYFILLSINFQHYLHKCFDLVWIKYRLKCIKSSHTNFNLPPTVSMQIWSSVMFIVFQKTLHYNDNEKWNSSRTKGIFYLNFLHTSLLDIIGFVMNLWIDETFTIASSYLPNPKTVPLQPA